MVCRSLLSKHIYRSPETYHHLLKYLHTLVEFAITSDFGYLTTYILTALFMQCRIMKTVLRN